jgi:DNA repair exonuclease SbcCD nuclease subunit
VITLVWRTDVHLAVRPPRSRTDDWTDTVLDKLRQVGEIAREVEADAVIDGGDFFHIKTPSRTTHALIQRVAQVHAEYPCPVYGLTGNHDVKYGDPAFINEAPLGVLFDTGVFKRLDAEGVTFNFVANNDDCTVTTVRVVGIPYHGKKYDQNRLTTIIKDAPKSSDNHYLVVAAHLLASQAGGEMFGSEDIVRYSDLVNLDPDVWCFGHWHKNQGITEAGGKIIVNIGSLTRGALNEDDVARVPEVAILRFGGHEDITVERRCLDVKPAKEVFDLEGRTRQEARSMTVDAFVESVKTTLAPQTRRPLLDDVRALDVPEPVRERLVLYLEAEGAS